MYCDVKMYSKNTYLHTVSLIAEKNNPAFEIFLEQVEGRTLYVSHLKLNFQGQWEYVLTKA